MIFLLAGWAKAVRNYSADVERIVGAVAANNSVLHHAAYERLSYISDTWGPRLWGSNTLEEVLREMEREARLEGFDNVRLEPVTNFTRWERGDESLLLMDPRPVPHTLKCIGLGWSVPANFTAEVMVVTDYAELEDRKSEVPGKIVLFNHPWVNYSFNVEFRANGPSVAAQYGAAAVLVRSVTPFSIYSVHAGALHYKEGVKKIPAAAITVEDAEMLARMQARNQTIKVHLFL
jgi:carboxypeptidase Q